MQYSLVQETDEFILDRDTKLWRSVKDIYALVESWHKWFKCFFQQK